MSVETNATGSLNESKGELSDTCSYQWMDIRFKFYSLFSDTEGDTPDIAELGKIPSSPISSLGPEQKQRRYESISSKSQADSEPQQ
jgi:hypothetical protein